MADFGVSSQLATCGMTNSVTGSPYWMAPEVIMEQSYSFEVIYMERERERDI